jgi:hypothetical protein
MQKSILKSLVLLVALAITSAEAGQIRSFEFTTLLVRSAADYPAAGTSLHGSFSYDLDALISPPYGGTTTASYEQAITNFSLDGVATMRPNGGQVIAINYHMPPPAYPLDQFTMFLDVDLFNGRPSQFLMRLRDERQQPMALTSNALPDTLDFSQFTNSYFEMGQLYGRITSLDAVLSVPEPETLLLTVVALGALCLTRRKHTHAIGV